MSTVAVGPDLVCTSDATAVLRVAPDGMTFTVTYSDYQVGVNAAGQPSRIAARWESFVLSRVEQAEGAEVTVQLSGYSFTQSGAHATVILGVNGTTDVAEIPPDNDDGFVRSVTYRTTAADQEIRVAIGVLVEGDPESVGSVGILSIDGNGGVETDNAPARAPAASV